MLCLDSSPPIEPSLPGAADRAGLPWREPPQQLPVHGAPREGGERSAEVGAAAKGGGAEEEGDGGEEGGREGEEREDDRAEEEEVLQPDEVRAVPNAGPHQGRLQQGCQARSRRNTSGSLDHSHFSQV